MYFPKSQIKPNLYTNGGEYTLSTTKQNYIGYYYETYTGQKFTGKTPQDGPNILLITSQLLNDLPASLSSLNSDTTIILPNSVEGDYPMDFDFLKYPKITDFKNRVIPTSNPTFPTDQDNQLGVYTRYFCKKNNELKYMEIDKNTFQLLSTRSNNIAWDLYIPISTLWYLQFNSSNINKNLVNQIEKNQKWYGFTQWFQEKF